MCMRIDIGLDTETSAICLSPLMWFKQIIWCRCVLLSWRKSNWNPVSLVVCWQTSEAVQTHALLLYSQKDCFSGCNLFIFVCECIVVIYFMVKWCTTMFIKTQACFLSLADYLSFNIVWEIKFRIIWLHHTYKLHISQKFCTNSIFVINLCWNSTEICGTCKSEIIPCQMMHFLVRFIYDLISKKPDISYF